MESVDDGVDNRFGKQRWHIAIGVGAANSFAECSKSLVLAREIGDSHHNSIGVHNRFLLSHAICDSL